MEPVASVRRLWKENRISLRYLPFLPSSETGEQERRISHFLMTLSHYLSSTPSSFP